MNQSSPAKGRRSLHLATQFNTLVIVLILVTALAISIYLVGSEIRNNNRQLANRLRTTAAMVVQNSEYALYTTDPAALQDLLNLAFADEDIAYVVIFDQHQHLLAKKPDWIDASPRRCRSLKRP